MVHGYSGQSAASEIAIEGVVHVSFLLENAFKDINLEKCENHFIEMADTAPAANAAAAPDAPRQLPGGAHTRVRRHFTTT